MGTLLGNKSRADPLASLSKGDGHDMITKEEQAIFEYEIKKLLEEYQECPDSPLKQKIKEDVLWLKSAIFSTSTEQRQK